jgi:D-alanyl-D-alanine carboxypeptidase/D-alanyl-D-alanine-endopeptidase (penicillin-binding protein 4)
VRANLILLVLEHKQSAMKLVFVIVFAFFSRSVFSQTPAQRLSTALTRLQEDPRLSHALISIYVVDSKSGIVVFDKNSQLGMAPASTQKVVTSASAYELLGKDFTYNTTLAHNGEISGTSLNGDILFTGTGDPTLGSWRWKNTAEEAILNRILETFKQKNVIRIKGNFLLNNSRWETQQTPRGWIWEDVGNYYGAGAGLLNWRENQYELILKPGKSVGDPVSIISTKPSLKGANLYSELKTGAAGSGDNAIIYLPENGTVGIVRGTIPSGKETFTIKGSFPFPAKQFQQAVWEKLEKNGVSPEGNILSNESNNSKIAIKNEIVKFVSPSLDSINYWFMRESLNLYGEAFVKTIAFEKKGFGATDSGIAIIRDFWSQRGIEKSALKIIDGSGLSPANRLTTHSLVTVLQYAKKQKWYSSFYHSLPEMNGIKMKSGYITGVRSYAGYIQSKAGTEYSFAFIINNFDGSAAAVREKMWEVLNILK